MDQDYLQNWLRNKKNRREQLTVDKIFEGILKGNRVALSDGITLVESSKSDDREKSIELIKSCLPSSGKSIRIGITGVPGVGKSTFIESFGKLLVQKGKKVAVLAVDPSSSKSGGSILGDKTRMQELSQSEHVFIRPTAAGVTLGGVARSTREAIILCEAAGYDFIIVETVGVGQSETSVKSMVDFFLLLMLSGAGDELQGIKKGIMEMADALVVTKADGENVKLANLAATQYRNAMHLFPPNENDWIPSVFTCSSQTGDNIEKVFDVISSFENKMNISGWLEHNRHEQEKHWLRTTLNDMILDQFYTVPELMNELKEIESKLMDESIPFYAAAEQLFNAYLKHISNGRV